MDAVAWMFKGDGQIDKDVKAMLIFREEAMGYEDFLRGIQNIAKFPAWCDQTPLRQTVKENFKKVQDRLLAWLVRVWVLSSELSDGFKFQLSISRQCALTFRWL